jgi:hypothetical protein
VALLAVLAVVFGLAGTVAPPLAEEVTPSQFSSSSSSVAHFTNPPTYDSGWVDIAGKCGRYFSLEHDLNTTEVVVDITGKQSLDPMGGAPAWTKIYGGTSDDYCRSVVRTVDGGYALAGTTNSYGAGNGDAWLVKTNSAGNALWNKTYGTAYQDYARSVVQTSDDGYALAGYTHSYGASGYDAWLVKTNSAGNALWNKTYGGIGSDYAYSVVQTGDGGYALTGYKSYGAGSYDFWLVKTDASGNALWNKTYGGADSDIAYAVLLTGDGGYALAGFARSFGAGGDDFWLVKTDSAGTMMWNKTYGGINSDYAYSVVQTDDGGYALAGTTNSFGAGSGDSWLVKTDASGTLQWNRTYGGTGYDYGLSLVQTVDGGYALAGYTDSYGAGGYDAWLVKTNSAGNALWNGTYGGTVHDVAFSLVQTGDGGYALAGYTDSYGAAGYDAWLVRVKPEMNLEHQRYLGGTNLVYGWSRTYGVPGTGDEETDADEILYSVIQTLDGGYALAGFSNSYAAGGIVAWLVKTDSAGTMQWNKTYGDTNTEVAHSVIQTVDGGYALAGSVGSSMGNAWLVKTGASGFVQWGKTYGGTNTDIAYSVVQTIDGGYALAGYTRSFGAGASDFWLVKTNSAGTALWNKTYGGTDGEGAVSVVQTVDGGYALAGSTTSFGAGANDFWLVKTDSAGTMMWNKTYGGTNIDIASSMVQTLDGGYALVGYTRSFGAGNEDFWLVKTDSSGAMQWNKTYGGTSDDPASSLVQTLDGGYALAGDTVSFGTVGVESMISRDFWLVKTDSDGTVQWSKTYGGEGQDSAISLVQTSDGGLALAGYTDSFCPWQYETDWDFYLVKTDGEMGLARTGLTSNSITLYRGKTDLYWNYVCVRIWLIKEPTWIYGDINMDGVVDAKDLYIVGRNYGKTFSLLSLTGIIALAGIHTVKKRKQTS